MKNVSVLILVLLIIVVLLFALFSFQLRQTEVAVITTFGKPTESVSTPRLYFKWPEPINSVYKFDARTHLLEGVPEETNTKGTYPVVLTSYMAWRIGEPLKFLEAVQDKAGAEKELKSLLRHIQNTVIGQHYFSDIVNSDPEKVKFARIEQQMLEMLKKPAAEKYGIEVSLVGIKQLGIDKGTTEKVFERIRAERQQKTQIITSQGNAEAERIRSGAEAKTRQLLAYVEAQAEAIRGQGQAEAAGYYEMLEEDPEFAMFLRNIEALKKILMEKTTIVLGADAEPLSLLKEIPDIKPNNTTTGSDKK